MATETLPRRQMEIVAEYQSEYQAGRTPPSIREVSRRLGMKREFARFSVRVLVQKGWLESHSVEGSGICYRLSRKARQAMDRQRSATRKLEPLTALQKAVLDEYYWAYIAGRRRVSQCTIASRLRISQSAVKARLDRLVRRGWLESDGGQSTRRRYRLTPSALVYLQSVVKGGVR